MYVIADIEWITDDFGRHFPTQLAGIRVDEGWNQLNEFASFIRPSDVRFNDWRHIACTGGTAEKFLSAQSESEVLSAFLDWLLTDDILLWWHGASEELFQLRCNELLSNRKLPQAISINRFVYGYLEKSKRQRDGGPYDIGQRLGIAVRPELKHSASNDVRVLRELLSVLCFPKEELLKPMEKPNGSLLPQKQYASLIYQYDEKDNRIHVRDCPQIRSVPTKSYGSLNTPIRKGYLPCSCCRKAYQEALAERNLDILNRSQYVYAFSPSSAIYHKPSCPYMRHVRRILGARKYSTIVKTGRTPCKVCKPMPEDQFKPLPVAPKVKLPAAPTLAPSAEGEKAIKRQQAAIRERSVRLNDESLTDAERNDIYTLTQPHFVFWSSQGYSNFHLRSCQKLQGLSNLRGFSTFSEAVRSGYLPCRKCRPSAKYDAKFSIPIGSRTRNGEKVSDLVALCVKAGYSYLVEADRFFLQTPVGKWQIHLDAAPIKLDHINLVTDPDAKEYHEQPRLFLSLFDTFKYIKRHDDTLARKKAAGVAFVGYFHKE